MRTRPLCIATICYIIGIIMGLYLQMSIVFLLWIELIVTIFIYICFHKKCIFIYSVCIMMGFCMISIVDNSYMKQYENIDKDNEYLIEAVIVSEGIDKEYKTVYEIEIKTINRDTKYQGKRWLLNVKNNKSNNIELSKNMLQKENNNKSQKDIKKEEGIQAKKDYSVGDLISFYGKTEIPTTARNYMGFDYRQYLKSQGIYGTIQMEQIIEKIESNKVNIFASVIQNIKSNIRQKLYQVLPEDIAALCVGVLVGERNGITEEISNNFKKSNLTHLLAVSGAHMSYIIWGLTVLLQKTKYRFRHICIMFFLLFFMMLTGFTASVQRAGIMTIVAIIGKLLYRKSDTCTTIAISCFIILLFNPYTILDIGFQLSYGGTLGIVWFSQKLLNWVINKLERIKIKRWFKLQQYITNAISVTIAANLVIIPIMAFQFNTISFTFWISNLLAGPLLGMIIILGFFVYFVSIFSISVGTVIAIPLKFFSYLLLQIASICSKIPFSSVIVRTPFIFEIVIYYAMIFICSSGTGNFIRKCKEKSINIKRRFFAENDLRKFLCVLKRHKIKAIVVVLILIMSVYIIFTIINIDNLKVHFIDVGQGDCTLIITPSNKTILIDGGGSEMGNFDVGEKTLLPYLLDRKITKIDYMMISHFDADHVGGLLYILEYITVKNVIVSKQGKISENYERFRELIEEKNIAVMMVKKGDRVLIEENIYFDILFPEDNLISNNVLNNNSIVAKLHYEDISFLFTGDIEAVAEKRLVELYENTDILHSTIIKIAHHGSKSSSIEKFLKLVKPKVALIGVGEKNTFGHPNQGVLERLEKLGVVIYRTDLYGEITLEINANRRIWIDKMIN